MSGAFGSFDSVRDRRGNGGNSSIIFTPESKAFCKRRNRNTSSDATFWDLPPRKSLLKIARKLYSRYKIAPRTHPRRKTENNGRCSEKRSSQPRETVKGEYRIWANKSRANRGISSWIQWTPGATPVPMGTRKYDVAENGISAMYTNILPESSLQASAKTYFRTQRSATRKYGRKPPALRPIRKHRTETITNSPTVPQCRYLQESSRSSPWLAI